MIFEQIDYIPGNKKYQTLHGLLEQDWAMLLDSGTGLKQKEGSKANRYRRYDICVCQPSVRLSYDNEITSIYKGSQQTQSLSDKAPLECMREILNEYRNLSSNLSYQDQPLSDLPFNGGWIGYISYDFGLQQTINSNDQISDFSIPLIQMGLYQWALISDHQNKTTRLYNFGLTETNWLSLKSKVVKLITDASNKPLRQDFQLSNPFKSNLSFKDYAKGFNQIRDYIYAGDCYQVNFAQRFSAEYQGSILTAYESLAKENNSPFSAYLNFSNQQILSLSPERFIEAHRGNVTTQPIKGTLPRDPDPKLDQQLANQLINSNKDKAENLMIVDLLRNDLSKTASKGSVKVSELFGLYHFESVHHLISTVTSKLDDTYDNFDLLATTLPGGSITGAPKLRAMQIIDELESTKRGIYCGIIGYIDFIDNMDTNICIRTLISDSHKLYCWAGGGLVADSQLDLEYQETFDKLNKILPILDQTVILKQTATLKPIMGDKNL